MFGFRSSGLLVILIVLTLFAGLFAQAPLANGGPKDDSFYDARESIRRLLEAEKRNKAAQEDAARQRYDVKYGSSGDSTTGVLCCIGIIIIIVVYFVQKNKMEKEQIANQAWEAERKEKQKVAFNDLLKKANSLGFSMEEETRVCPACAEKIKLPANICRYCKKEFSEEERNRDIETRINQFLREKGSI